MCDSADADVAAGIGEEAEPGTWNTGDGGRGAVGAEAATEVEATEVEAAEVEAAEGEATVFDAVAREERAPDSGTGIDEELGVG